MSRISCIVYPPTVDYDFLTQRPQQLMKCFAEMQIPSYFINYPLFKTFKGIKMLNSHFYLVNSDDISRFVNKQKPVVYFSLPEQINMVKKYNPALVVFDSVDEPSEEFRHWSRFYTQAVEQADIVLASSDKLYQMALMISPNTYLIPNGCDYKYFSRAIEKDLPVPEDIKNIPRPIIGYIGAVASWCDLNLIEKLAEQFPRYSVVMIGPFCNISKVPQRENLYWLGRKSYDLLAAYIQEFSVGIIPFRKSSMIESVNPIKMWEYLAAGLPVVTTDIPEARKYPQIVMSSQDNKQLIENIRLSIQEDSQEKKLLRLNLARQNSWQTRAREVVNIIEEMLEKREPTEKSESISNLSGYKERNLKCTKIPCFKLNRLKYH
jgi:glycosyltransferase involved in cell wall biosynthesis